MKRPPLRSKDIFWIIVAIALGLLFICVVIGNAANPQNSTTATPGDQTITDTPTMDIQAAIPTIQPTPLLFHGALRGTMLGGSQDAFTAKYGQPSSTIGEAFFYSNLQVGVLKGTQLVFTVLVGAPEHQTWTMATGMVQCASFLPADRERQESFKTFDGNQQDGLAVVYESRALGQVFPASQFTDINHHLVTPGTFTVAYAYLFNKQKNIWDNHLFLQCEIDLGIPDYLKSSLNATGPTAQSTPRPQLTSRPTPKPTPAPTQAPTQAPATTGVDGNPWGYDFRSGNLITNPPANFCSYFPCIATFWAADDPDGGYVIQCADGDFSQSGGESGSCSHHGGDGQTLYSH